MSTTGRAAGLPVPVRVRPVLVTALTAFVLTLLLSGLILPGLLDFLPALPTAVQLFLLILLSSAARVMAGVVGARRLREERGTRVRSDAFASVAVGGAMAWLLALGLALSAGAVGSVAALLLDLVRWVGECVVGALCVTPGDPADAAHPYSTR